MLNLIKVDLFKMCKSKLIKIMFCISVLSAILMLIFSHMIAAGKIDMQSSGFTSLFADAQVITLIGCVIIGIFFCNDFDYKVIENAISSGNSRWSIVLSKIISFIIIMLIILIPYVIISLIVSRLDMNFAVYIPTGFLNIIGLAANGASIGKILLIDITTIIIYVAQLSIGIFIMFLIRKSTYVVPISYVLLIILGPIFSLNDTAKKIMSYTPYGIDFTEFTLSTGIITLAKPIIVSVVFIVIVAIISYLAFRKVEIK